MGINHGSLKVRVPEQFLNPSDVMSVFQQVGGKAVSQGMDGYLFGNASFLCTCFFKGPLKGGRLNTLAPQRESPGINREHSSRKKPEPAPLLPFVRELHTLSPHQEDRPQSDIHLT